MRRDVAVRGGRALWTENWGRTLGGGSTGLAGGDNEPCARASLMPDPATFVPCSHSLCYRPSSFADSLGTGERQEPLRQR